MSADQSMGDVEIRSAGDELIVYRLETHETFLLDAEAASAFRTSEPHRRALLKGGLIGGALLGVGTVQTILAPPAAAAGSGGTPNVNLTLSPTTTSVGGSYTPQVSVTGTGLTGASPTGQVQLKDSGGTTIETKTLTQGSGGTSPSTATFTALGATSSGAISYTVFYVGDSRFNSATSPTATETVTPSAGTATSTTSVAGSTKRTGVNDTITATISASGTGPSTAGYVTFTIKFDNVTQSTVTVATSAGSASTTIVNPAAGVVVSVTAVFSGNATTSGSSGSKSVTIDANANSNW